MTDNLHIKITKISFLGNIHSALKEGKKELKTETNIQQVFVKISSVGKVNQPKIGHMATKMWSTEEKLLLCDH